ncbi:hypothetical protein CLOSTHATH_04655 [Hungatella hathewayi DSM 13479]|uniref:Uncharacterized protein n=1 Tax=Hungatella hathewayi DSM 13479 TaxID=566550 RepID=D3AM08_9FIRM|nr:hypothetical protein CLOSTHATH_04655 [Hungatella hathewayi DSM 13479]
MGNITLLNVNILLYTFHLHGFIMMLLLRRRQDLNDIVTQKQPWGFFCSAQKPDLTGCFCCREVFRPFRSIYIPWNGDK